MQGLAADRASSARVLDNNRLLERIRWTNSAQRKPRAISRAPECFASIVEQHVILGIPETHRRIGLPYPAIRTLHSRIETLGLKEEAGAERRLSETLQRLIKAACIDRSDFARIGLAVDMEYQITPLGDSIAQWHIQQQRFSGEPLAAIQRAFISQLTLIADAAASAKSPDEWRINVAQQMNYALRETLWNQLLSAIS
ncbi:hypothetical protein [Pandoraea commovens]|uniref:Uncharacterized protein n=1 Tax=Pandoraea commovens TaxID=2508289 RepID=A0ABY5QG33_9BURK|nr:hypothetical protein [Pandoraea commovens]UVA79554.1 hypothetical protein NTU39_00455 [Pandoraea commovens]